MMPVWRLALLELFAILILLLLPATPALSQAKAQKELEAGSPGPQAPSPKAFPPSNVRPTNVNPADRNLGATPAPPAPSAFPWSDIKPPSTSPREPGPPSNVVPSSADPAVPGPQAPRPLWGAVAFTADGSFWSAWRAPNRAEAELFVLKQCAKANRGACEVIGFSGELCSALVHWAGRHSGRFHNISYTGGGRTAADAQQAARDRCQGDKNVRGQCQLRTVVCGDGR